MRPPRQKPQTDARPPVAVSYIRFSSPEQRKGDSLRRQTADTERWCERSGVPLDRDLSCKDAGRSAYHGRHRSDRAALGQFLDLVKEGKVPRGSFLVIENLDRLSREDERTALRLWLDILDAGINIVQLHPETVFRHEKSDMVDIMRAIIELSRGHSESRMKSVRTLANWERAVRLARENGRTMTRRLPGWVELTDAGLALIPERAAVVRRIFEMARAGYGMTSIVKKLIAGNVPPFGDRELAEDADGNAYWRAAEGARYGCGEWRTCYVRSLLGDRRAIGQLQPRDAADRKKGEPIEGYYPRVVSDEEFYAARAAVVKRTNGGAANRQGRIGVGVANLFGGLMRHARDGDTYYVASRKEKGVTTRFLRNKTSVENSARAYTFPYEVFEREILGRLREIRPEDIAPAVPLTEVSALQGRLNELREQKAALALDLLKGYSPMLAEAARQLEAREAELLGQIDENAETVAAPRADAWGNVRTLVDVMDGAEDREDVRLRLRAAIRRCVDSVWLLVVPKGRDRMCAVQVWFSGGGGRHRDYLIYFKPAHRGFGGYHPGGTWTRDFAAPAGVGDFDLRRRADAKKLELLLSALDTTAL
jgi:DNA invertase Pin-like site-specific DNA recombinase